jgi:hypothetical protein
MKIATPMFLYLTSIHPRLQHLGLISVKVSRCEGRVSPSLLFPWMPVRSDTTCALPEPTSSFRQHLTITAIAENVIPSTLSRSHELSFLLLRASTACERRGGFETVQRQVAAGCVLHYDFSWRSGR